MFSLPLNMAGSLFLAILLNQKIRGTYFYRLVFFLPSVLSGVAIFYLWRWMYNPDFGLINNLLAYFGIAGPHWLTDPLWAKPALMIMGLARRGRNQHGSLSRRTPRHPSGPIRSRCHRRGQRLA
ncbi:MAG: sugar ABC transporter permease [Blastochloris sp.]|nr:sugar ABC transporter permease [Blastochloris sp.]